MKVLTNITNNATQKFSLTLDDNTQADFILYFNPTINAWFFDIIYKNWSSLGNKLVLSPNILRRFHNQIKFGMSCVAIDNVEPFDINDFISERVNLYVLNNDDISVIEVEFYG